MTAPTEGTTPRPWTLEAHEPGPDRDFIVYAVNRSEPADYRPLGLGHTLIAGAGLLAYGIVGVAVLWGFLILMAVMA